MQRKLRLLAVFLFFVLLTVVVSVALLNNYAGVDRATQDWRVIAKQQLAELTGWVSDIPRRFRQARTLPKPAPTHPESPTQNTTPEQSDVSRAGSCVAASALESEETGRAVYSWVDANGVTHFSDEAPRGDISPALPSEAGSAGIRADIDAEGVYVSDAVASGLIYCEFARD